jgi:hypothetical protein
MHDLAFADAARPTPVVVLKLPLRDYSLGHELLLLQSRNPLLCASETEFNDLPHRNQVMAIRNAVWICSNTWEQNEFEWFSASKAKIWSWLSKRSNIPLAIAEFRNYLATGRQLLPTPSVDDYLAANGISPEHRPEGRCYGRPWLAGLYNFIAPQWRGSNSPWNCGFGFAGMLYQAHLESVGGYFIENDRELETRLEMAEHREHFAREEAQPPPSPPASAPDSPIGNRKSEIGNPPLVTDPPFELANAFSDPPPPAFLSPPSTSAPD